MSPPSTKHGWIVLAALCCAACGSKTGLLVSDCEDDGGECCSPERESCNGLDDDCDGAVDDGLACFFLDGVPIEAQSTERCGAEWYSYSSPDAESANPSPDIRIPDGVVLALQTGPACEGASLALITDIPRDESGGSLDVSFSIAPAGAAGLLVSDEPRECAFDETAGRGRCEFVWQTCCTDGLLLGPFVSDACVELTLDGASGVTPPEFLDGESRRRTLTYGVPFEVCAQIRPAVP